MKRKSTEPVKKWIKTFHSVRKGFIGNGIEQEGGEAYQSAAF